MKDEEKDLEATVTRLRETISKLDEAKTLAENRSLQLRWQAAIKAFTTTKGKQGESEGYPRMDRLFEIVRQDGRTKLMLNYDRYNPDPDFTDEGQRRQVEAILKFELPLIHLMEQAFTLWRSGDFEGEATLLEEYAISNPQKEAILDLAEEARREAVSGASAKTRQNRR